MLDAAGVPADVHGTALVALDKLDKIGLEGVGRELRERGDPPGDDGQYRAVAATAAAVGERVRSGEANHDSIDLLRQLLAGHARPGRRG